jgi:ribonuclease P protein component
MISQKYRFHGHGSLQRVYQNGKTVRSPVLGLRYERNERRKNFRVAVVVAKTVSKSAVTRNRLRRRLYEIVRLQAPAIVQPYDLIITVYKPYVQAMTAHELSDTIVRLLRQAQVIEGKTGLSATHAIIEAKEP